MMLAVAPVAIAKFNTLAELMFSWEPVATVKSAPAPPPIVKVLPVAAA
jgi:hypothetical protein